jgi:CheY-like chemotaxis protein
MTPRTRVLIIEDDQDYEHLLTAALTGCQSGFEVITAGTLAEALAILTRLRPDIILLDLDLPDSTGYATLLRAREHAGEAPIIVLTSYDEERLALRAAADGAEDYLVKNMLPVELLPRHLRLAMARHSHATTLQNSTRAGMVLGFIGSKGGVGTSTVAVNVATLLAQNGSDTTFMELHAGPGAASMYMQAKPSHDLNALTETPADKITPARLQQCACEPIPGLRLIQTYYPPRIPLPIGADYALRLISAARLIGTHLVLDLPARLDEGAAAALELCDTICMVVDREPAAIHFAAEMLRQIRSLGPQIADVNIVEVDRTRLEGRLTSADFRSRLQRESLIALRPAAAAIYVSHSAGIPLVSLYPEDPFSLAIRDLTVKLLAPFAQGARWVEPFRRISSAAADSFPSPELRYA